MADETGKIYIIVTNKLPGGSGGEAAITTETRSESSRDKNLLQHYAMNKFINTLKSSATSWVNYGLSNIGNFTGDYVTQANVNFTRQILTSIGNIGLSAWAGFKATGSPWGALIGAGAATINETSSLVQKYISIDIQTKKTNYAIRQIRERSGLDTAKNGNRGTEY